MEACGLFPKDKRLSFLFISILLQQEKHAEAMDAIENALLTFGLDDDILSAALAVREKLGPRVIAMTHTKTGTLSVCMIVKNEEKHIAKCLASIKPVADEIIVVDTGSTDRTKDISVVFGAQVYDFPWTNDFSEARNASLEKARGDWILVHDADEVLSPLDHDKFIQILRNKRSRRPIAYEITTRNYIMEPAVDGWTANNGEYREEESGSGWFPSTKVRLFTNDRRIRFSNPVHEILEPSIIQAGMEMKHCSIPIHHYGKLPSETSTKKADAYYLLGKQKLERMGNVPIALRELAIQAEELGKHEEAIEHWRAYAKAIPGKSLPYFNMATIYLEMEQFEQALNTAKMAYEIDPDKKETILTYATMSMCAGDAEEAVEHLETLVKRINYPPAEVALAIGYCVAGRTEEGFMAMTRMKAKGYNYDLALHSFSRKLVSAGRTNKAISLLECILKCNGTDCGTIALLDECRAQSMT
jgi:glycosyltransferase involved in cell wall biosynthesis